MGGECDSSIGGVLRIVKAGDDGARVEEVRRIGGICDEDEIEAKGGFLPNVGVDDRECRELSWGRVGDGDVIFLFWSLSWTPFPGATSVESVLWDRHFACSPELVDCGKVVADWTDGSIILSVAANPLSLETRRVEHRDWMPKTFPR